MAAYVEQNLHEHPCGWGEAYYHGAPIEHHAAQPTQEVVLCGGEGGIFPLHGDNVRQIAIKHRWDEGPDKNYPLQIWSSTDRKSWVPLGSLRDAQDFAEFFPVGDGVRYIRVQGQWSAATRCHIELAATT